MKAAFFHDTPLYTDGKDYYSISFTYGMWKSRYLKVFDELIVCTRVRNIADLSENVRKGYTISNGQGVVMAPVSAYKTLPDMFLKREKIRAQIKETLKNVDAAIIRLPSIIGLMACECCIEENVPWGVEVVTCVLDAYRGQGMKGRIVAPYLYRQNRKYIKMAGAAVYVTNNFLQQRYPTEAPSESISNVALDEPSGDVLERRLQKIEKMSEPVVFGLVGSLDVNFKGHDVAIRALAGIKNDIPDFRLQCLGLGNPERWEKFAREHGIGEKVEFCGALPSGNPVLNWMDSIDVLLVPSLQEGLPRALIEAMSRGCPALGAETGGIPELIETRFLHSKRDFVKLSDDIVSLISDRELMKKTAIRNFIEAKSYYSNVLEKRREAFWRSFAVMADSRIKRNDGDPD